MEWEAGAGAGRRDVADVWSGDGIKPAYLSLSWMFEVHMAPIVVHPTCRQLSMVETPRHLSTILTPDYHRHRKHRQLFISLTLLI